MTNEDIQADNPTDDTYSSSWQNPHIGVQGESWFASQLPRGWVLQQPQKDFGKDGLIVVRDNSGLHNLEFSVQVKTSEHPVIRDRSVVISGVSRSSVMYWFASPLPTLVVAVDIIKKRAWYAWHLDLFESPGELFRSDQKKVAIRIPENNRLNKEGWTYIRRDLKQHFDSLRDAVNDAAASSRLLPIINSLVRHGSNLLKLSKIPPPPNKNQMSKETGMSVLIEQLEHKNVLSVVRSLLKHVQPASSAALHLQAWIEAYETTVLSAYPNLNAIPENGPFDPNLEFSFAPKNVREIRPRLIEATFDMIIWLTSRQKPAEGEAKNDQIVIAKETVEVPILDAFRKIDDAQRSVGLARVTVTQLGFSGNATTSEILGAKEDVDGDGHPAPFSAGRGSEIGLELCPPKVAPYLRLEYKDQPLGERLLIAMKPIGDSDNEPRIFSVEHSAQGLSLDAVRARPDDIWQGSDEFVFSTGEAV